jgi:hypothetical protein
MDAPPPPTPTPSLKHTKCEVCGREYIDDDLLIHLYDREGGALFNYSTEEFDPKGINSQQRQYPKN